MGRRPAGSRSIALARIARALACTLALAVSGLTAAGCHNEVTTDEAAASTPRHGGTVVLATAQEPPTINGWLATGGMGIVAILTDPLRSPYVGVDPQGRYRPVLATRIPTLANGGVRRKGKGMVVQLDLQPHATWSDKVPITCRDVRFTWKTVMDDRWEIGSRMGWEHVTAIDCPTPRRALFHIDTIYAPYVSDLLGTTPLPEHELKGKDFNKVWSNEITLSSGPFVFRRWRRGVELVLERNPNYWNAGAQRRPYLDRIIYRFVPDAGTMKLDLRMGEVDLIGLPPDTNLPRELRSIRGAQVAIAPGAGWEQLTFNTQAPPLNDVRVRQAIAHAIDRDAIAEVVLRRQVAVLHSPLLPSQKPWHRPVFDRYGHDLTRVEELMGKAGWQRGEGGYWTQGGRVASVTLKSTTGNPLRLKMLQLMQQHLRRAGFRSTISLGKPEIFFSQVISHGDFHLAIYSFGSKPTPDLGRLFMCREIPKRPEWKGKNNFRYCNRDVDRLAAAANVELDPRRREQMLVAIQEQLARDVPALPLFQPPDTAAWSGRLHGVVPNSMGRIVWNTEDWWVDQ